MTVYKFKDLPKWATKVKKVMDAGVSQSVNDLLKTVEVVPGINRGGGRVRGTIPRDLGALASSLQSELVGSTSLSGELSYVLVAGQMEAGDVARFTWGGNVAPYAKMVHYGSNGVPGTYWVDVAATKWDSVVDAAFERIKRELG